MTRKKKKEKNYGGGKGKKEERKGVDNVFDKDPVLPERSLNNPMLAGGGVGSSPDLLGNEVRKRGLSRIRNQTN